LPAYSFHLALLRNTAKTMGRRQNPLWVLLHKGKADTALHHRKHSQLANRWPLEQRAHSTLHEDLKPEPVLRPKANHWLADPKMDLVVARVHRRSREDKATLRNPSQSTND
jgi:hypothetical protein